MICTHASWGSQQDVMLVFLNQDAYDRYRLSKEDFELLKEFEKEQKKAKEKDDEKTKDGKKSKAEKADKGNANKEGDKSKADKEKSKVDSSKDSNQDESADDKANSKNLVELNGIEDRIVRLTPNSSDLGSAILSKDGEDLYYFSAFEGGYDLWKMNLREKDTKRLHKLNTGWASLMLDKKGDIFLLGSRIMQKMDAKSDALKSISYQAEMKMDLAAERETMFDHVYKQHQKRFYNVNMHGVDWDAMTNAYRKFLPHIDNNYDFAELLSEWLGELNVSHTGGRYSPKGKGDVTSNLGLIVRLELSGKKECRLLK